MCNGPVGENQTYWGVIKVSVSSGELTESDLDDFKTKLTDFLNDASQTGLPNNVAAKRANGTIKTDDNEQDAVSIGLIDRV